MSDWNWRVGCSAYIWSQHLDLRDHFPAACAEMRAAGFEGVETFFRLAKDPQGLEAIRRGLRESGLVLAAFYVGGAFQDPEKHAEALAEAERAAQVLAELGGAGAVLIWGPQPLKDRRKRDDELARQAETCAALGETVHRLGLGPLCVHNHTPELLDDAKELDVILRATDAARVGLNLDLEWCAQADFDPAATVRRFGARVRHLHLRNSTGKVWCDQFGEGDLDYPQIAAALKETGYRGWLMLEDAWDGKRTPALSFKQRAHLGREAIRRWFGV